MAANIQIYQLPARVTLQTSDMFAVDDATGAHETWKVTLQQTLSFIQKNAGFSTFPFVTSAEVDYVLVNPCPTLIVGQYTTAGHTITLPLMNQIDSSSPSQMPYVFNNGTQSFDLLDNTGTLIVTVPPSGAFQVILLDISVPQGTFPAPRPDVISINGLSGEVTLLADDINSDYSPTNYTKTSSSIDGNLQGINNAIGANLGFPTGPYLFVNSPTVLTNPPPYYVFCAMASPGDVLTLPPAQGVGSIRKGQPIRVLCQQGSQSVQVNDSAGGAVQTLAIGDEVLFYLDTDSTTAGTWIGINAVTRVNLLSGDVGLSLQNIYDYLGGIIKTTSGNPLAITSTGVTPSPSASSLFDCQSTTQGARSSPEMNLTQRNAITSPASSLHVYNTTYKTIDYFDGSAWQTGLTLDNLLAGSNITLTQNGDGTVTVSSSGSSPSGNSDYAGYGINNNLTNTIFALTDTYYPVNVNSSNFIDITSSNFVNEIVTLSGIDTPAFRYIDSATQEFNFNINLSVYSATDIYIFQVVILKADSSYVYTDYFGSIIPALGGTIQTSSMPLSGIVELSTGDSILIFAKNSTGMTAINIRSGSANVSNVNAALAATLQNAYDAGTGIIQGNMTAKPFEVRNISGTSIFTFSDSQGIYSSTAGNSSAPWSSATFGSLSGSSTAGNLYGITINKFGVDSLLIGINKNSTTGSVIANHAFISTFSGSAGISFGRGDSAGLPNTVDFSIDGSGNFKVTNLSVNCLVATDSSNNFVSNTSGLSPIFTGITANTLISNATNDLTLSTPLPATNVNAKNINLNSSSGNGSGSSNGGSILFTAGNGAGASGATGGNISLTAGNSTAGSAAGAISLTAGTSNTTGGTINITSGAGANSSSTGGGLTLAAGASPGNGVAGNATLTGGGAGNSGNAGDVIISGGNAGTTGFGGNTRLRGGTSSGGTAGAVIVDQGSLNVSNLTASSLVGTDGTKNFISPITTANVATLSGNQTFTGRKQNSAQPCFLANISGNVSNVTGDSTVYTILYNTVAYDQASNFNSGTGTFTAPVSGKYILNAGIYISNISTAHTVGISKFTINGSSDYQLNVGNYGSMSTVSPNGILSISMCLPVSLNANDTVVIQLDIRNSTKTINILQNSGTFFSGYLLF